MKQVAPDLCRAERSFTLTHGPLGPHYRGGGSEIDEFSYQILRRSELCRGLSADEVRLIAAAVRERSVPAGEVVCRQGDSGESMFVVTRGRVKVAVERGGETYRLLDYLGRGEHFGEMAVLTGGLRTATVAALVDTQLWELDREHFDRLLARVPGFAANLSRSLGYRLHWETSRRERRHQPALVALVNSTLRTQGLIRPLAKALVEQGDSIEVLTDRAEKWPSDGAYLIERIPTNLPLPEKAVAVHERLNQVLEHHDRVLLELTQAHVEDELPRLLAPCEEIWWLVEPRFMSSSCQNLRKMLQAEPRLASRVRLVWILPEGEPFAPIRPEGLGIGELDFKVVLCNNPQQPVRQQQHGIWRLVRHLRGTRIGLALGGGGARGLAHLGVLRALERAGIAFDLLAGTSSGALMGMSYAGGWSPDEAIEAFSEALTPGRFWRAMPGGIRWYLWTMFRMGAWDQKMRPFLGDAKFEQLQVPFATVSVDLVSGKQVVRDRGDTIHAVLESINVPIISRPILRDGMALVDGGVLNNLPGDILPERGAALVVGVDVASRLPKSFGKNTAETPTSAMRRAGPLETLLRVTEVQAYGITALRTEGVDLMITPDTSAFEFADFTRAKELAEVGEAAAEQSLPQLKQMLADLDAG